MKILPPVSIEARRLLPSRWDLLAAILVLGFIVAFADASRFLVHPLSSISGHDLSLDPGDLPGYALRTALAHADRAWRSRWSSPSPMPPGRPRTPGPEPCWCRCSTSCSRCRSWAFCR